MKFSSSTVRGSVGGELTSGFSDDKTSGKEVVRINAGPETETRMSKALKRASDVYVDSQPSAT